MPPKSHLLPWLAVLALVVVLAGAGVTAWSGPDGGSEPTPDPFPAEPSTPLPDVAAPTVPRSRCGVVTFTPPTATDAHEADLCRPTGRSPRGAVVLVHGGGGYSGDRSTMTEWSDWYREQRFVTLSIDYTLLGDGSGEPVYPRPEQDLKAAIQWLRIQADPLDIDPAEIVLHGSSAGARLAAQAFVTPGDRWFTGPDTWAGVDDSAAALIGFYGYYDGDTLEAERYYGGLAGEGDRRVDRRWEHADSVAQAGDAPGPVLLFHGDVDGLITVAQTERFGAALAEVGADVTTFIVTDGDHAFDGRLGDLTTETGQDAADEIAVWLAERFPG